MISTQNSTAACGCCSATQAFIRKKPAKHSTVLLRLRLLHQPPNLQNSTLCPSTSSQIKNRPAIVQQKNKKKNPPRSTNKKRMRNEFTAASRRFATLTKYCSCGSLYGDCNGPQLAVLFGMQLVTYFTRPIRSTNRKIRRAELCWALRRHFAIAIMPLTRCYLHVPQTFFI